jgi:hypothetical protein
LAELNDVLVAAIAVTAALLLDLAVFLFMTSHSREHPPRVCP